MTKPARFTQADIERAMKAARKAGFSAPRVVLRPNGEIEIVTAKAQNAAANDEDDFEL